MGQQHGRSSGLGVLEFVLFAHVPQHDSRRSLRALRFGRLQRPVRTVSERREGHSLPRHHRFRACRGGNPLARRAKPRVLFDFADEIPIWLGRSHFRACFLPSLSRRVAMKPFSIPEPRFSSSPRRFSPFSTPSSRSSTPVSRAFHRGRASSTGRR